MKALAMGLVSAIALLALTLVWTSSGGARKAAAPQPSGPETAAHAGPERLQAQPEENPSAPTRSIATEANLDGHAPAASSEPESGPQARIAFRLEAKVVDTAGDGIPGAEIHDGDVLLCSADASGGFAAEVAARNLTRWRDRPLRISASNFVPATVEVDIAAGSTVRLGTIVLEPGVLARGFVTDEAGRPLERAAVGWLPRVPESELTNGDFDFEALQETRTGAAGRFEFFVPLGGGRLIAGAPGFEPAWGAPLDARLGATFEQSFRLVPDGTAWALLEGVVLDPNGSPAPGARVTASCSGETNVEEADEGGRFRFELQTEGPVTLIASDSTGRNASSAPQVVSSGSEIVLRLKAPTWIHVHLLDEQRTPIPWSQVRSENVLFPAGESGVARIPQPRTGELKLVAYAPGYRTRSFGPFDVAELGDDLELVLEPGSFVRGRVLADGRGVPNARLGLSKALEPGRTTRSSELAPLEWPFSIVGFSRMSDHDATTDSDGNFLLTLHESAWHALRVEAEGFPVTVFGAFDWAKEGSYEGIDLELEGAGAIEGSVLVPRGSEAAGRIVGVSDGWSIVHTAVTDEAGHYRISNLAPGTYQVRPCQPPAAAVQNVNGWWSEEGARIEWDCTVSAGATTEFDLDLTGDMCELAGRLNFGEADMRSWKVALSHVVGERRSMWQEVQLTEEGRFEFSLWRGGPVRLWFNSDAGHFEQDLELSPGPTNWEATVEAGTVVAARNVLDSGDLTLQWSNASGLEFSGWIEDGDSDATGAEDRVLSVPAGLVTVERRGVHLVDIEVRAGEETVLDLDE